MRSDSGDEWLGFSSASALPSQQRSIFNLWVALSLVWLDVRSSWSTVAPIVRVLCGQSANTAAADRRVRDARYIKSAFSTGIQIRLLDMYV